MGLLHDKLKAKMAARAGFGWKPKDGDNKIFILPPASQFVGNLDAMDSLAFQYHGHYFKIEGKTGEATRCLQDLGQKCPVCAMWRAFANSADPALKEMAKQIKPVDIYLFNIIDLAETQKGVQRWGANWTCWSKIMEIATNTAWGYVMDPANGIIFVINLVPQNKSRTGYNAYSVTPEPTRMQVMDLLNSLEGGLTALDGIEEATMEVKSVEDITQLLEEMNFPPLHAMPGGGAAPAAPALPRGVAPVGMPASIVPSVAGAQPLPPRPAAPMPVAAAASAPAPIPMAVAAPAAVVAPVAAVASAAMAAPAAVMAPPPPPVMAAPGASAFAYQPPAGYVEKVPASERPAGAPRCWADYNPAIHQCQICPFMSPCQMRTLGIS